MKTLTGYILIDLMLLAFGVFTIGAYLMLCYIMIQEEAWLYLSGLIAVSGMIVWDQVHYHRHPEKYED